MFTSFFGFTDPDSSSPNPGLERNKEYKVVNVYWNESMCDKKGVIYAILFVISAYSLPPNEACEWTRLFVSWEKWKIPIVIITG